MLGMSRHRNEANCQASGEPLQRRGLVDRGYGAQDGRRALLRGGL